MGDYGKMNEAVKAASEEAAHNLRAAAGEAYTDVDVALSLTRKALLLLSGIKAVRDLADK